MQVVCNSLSSQWVDEFSASCFDIGWSVHFKGHCGPMQLIGEIKASANSWSTYAVSCPWLLQF